MLHHGDIATCRACTSRKYLSLSFPKAGLFGKVYHSSFESTLSRKSAFSGKYSKTSTHRKIVASALSSLNFRVGIALRASFYSIESPEQPQFLALKRH